MIEWYRNRVRHNRLFINKHSKHQFLDVGSNNLRVTLIRQINTMRLNFQNNELDEIKARRDNLKLHGLIAPNNEKECLGMIEDLRKYKI